ncbi:hypothetical protein [Nocardiopsis sp. NRRL B-16309]|uniref:hypothetical protein n=1 Tax=Nocardiopsis sp. NRRL B-16309 TaxID=1519494 RepID=UPI0006AF655A|nr:hypothetical protein [Nocardiopsis sp. NRRL B-16309]KOX09957.1 hypothetical protein ADL05_24690 [Nocardiopsis sp. NRRL B-16309]
MLTTDARTLLSALLRDLPGDHHVLTLNTGHPMSTAIDARGEGFDVEHPAVVERLCAAISRPSPSALVLRTLTDRISHTLPDGTAVPVTLVRGWRVGERTLFPLDEAEMFNAHCTDAASGEPVPPERGVEYAGAPEIDLAAFDELR